MAISQTSLPARSAGQAGHVTDHGTLHSAVNDLTTVFNGWATTDRGVKTGALVLNVKDYGAIGDGVTDDTAAFVAAEAAAGPDARTVLAPSGIYKITSKVSFRTGVSLRGDGNNMSGSEKSGTRILCATSATAGLEFVGSGGLTSGFTVDGGGIATYPMRILLGAQRTFLAIDVETGAQDNWTIEKAQNIGFYGCSSQGAARDNLVLDLGCGGLLFSRFEANSPGRHGLRISQSGTSAEVYAAPTHIKFDVSLFEGATTNNAMVNIEAADFIRFDHCIITTLSSNTAPTVAYGNTGHTEFYACRFFGPAGPTISHTSTGRVMLTGYNSFFGVSGQPALDATVSGSRFYLYSYPFLNSGMILHSAGTTTNTQFVNKTPGPMWIVRDATSDTALDVSLEADTGRRLRISADGSIGIGDGTGFSYTTKLSYVAGVGLSLAGGMRVVGAWSCNNATPRTAATLPAAATDLATAISLVNAIRTALINNGIGV